MDDVRSGILAQLPVSTQLFLQYAPPGFWMGRWLRHEQFVGCTGLGKSGVSYQLALLVERGIVVTRAKSARRGSTGKYRLYRLATPEADRNAPENSEQMPNFCSANRVTL